MEETNSTTTEEENITYTYPQGDSFITVSPITGVGPFTKMCLVTIEILFFIAMAVSVFLMIKVSVASGVILAFSSILACGLIFIMGDILKNIAEINKKTKG